MESVGGPDRTARALTLIRLADFKDILLLLWAVALPISIAAATILFGLCAAVWLVEMICHPEKNPFRDAIFFTFVAFWGFSHLSALVGPSYIHSFRRELGDDLYIFFYWIPLVLVTSRAQATKAFAFFRWAVFATACLGVIQFLISFLPHSSAVLTFLDTLPSKISVFSLHQGTRPFGTRSHPLTYAEGLLLAWPFIFASFLDRQQKSPWNVIIMFVTAGGIFASLSRGPWLYFIATAVTLWLLMDVRAWKRVALGLGVPLLLFFAVPTFHQRASTIADVQMSSNRDRLRMWKAAKAIFSEHPVWGVGPGHLKKYIAAYQTPEELADGGPWGHVHNTFFQLFVERGVLAGVSFLGLLGAFLAFFIRKRRTLTDDFSRRIANIAIGTWVAFVLAGLTEAAYNDAEILMTFYWLMGMYAAILFLPVSDDSSLS